LTINFNDLFLFFLSVGTQQQAIGALSHVQRIIKEKSYLFIKETPKRHRPP